MLEVTHNKIGPTNFKVVFRVSVSYFTRTNYKELSYLSVYPDLKFTKYL